ncbi:MAG: hypothetical protein KGZ83_04260 [Sulfuricella sp.]|nr:hypothetical protein [Sulfuricella sp.]
MKKRISISTKFSMSNWQQLDSFIATTHGENHVLRNRPLFDWFFLRNENKDEANLIVAYEEGKLISLLGYIPTKFMWGREEVKGAWMAHWMTLEGYRFGIGALLMKKITEMFPIVAGQGASMMNQNIVAKMGFKFLEKIPKVVYAFKCDKLEKMFHFQASHKFVGVIAEHDSPSEVRIITKENFNPDWDNYPSMMYGTLKNRDYLTHRYIDYPFFKYYVFIEGEPASPAVCAVRIVETKEGIRVARMVEFFFPENESGKRQGLLLARKCLNFFKKNDCDYADFYCSGPAYMALLLEVGFIEEDTGGLPCLLDPIDMSRKSQNVELCVSSALKIRYPNCEDNFFVTRSDADSDRPNESYCRIKK